MSKINEVSLEVEREVDREVAGAGAGAVDYRTACLRLPRFPLQLLQRQRPEWREEPAVWLDRLKPEAPVRFANRAARSAGLAEGVRYAAALGLLPDLRAGCHSPEELQAAEERLLGCLRRFSPGLSRPSRDHPPGLYLLDVGGLGRAFQGYRRWARQLLEQLQSDGWEPLLALGFSPFPLETATYLMTPERPFQAFADRAEEQRYTLSLPLRLFELPPEAVTRLRRFGLNSLEQLLALDPEELKRRFPGPIYELYERAAEALFAQPEPLVEQAPLWAHRGFPIPVDEAEVLVRAFEELLRSLLPTLARREEAVAALTFALRTESGKVRRETVRLNTPSLERRWLVRLLQARLETHLRRQPLAWSDRVEAVALQLDHQVCPEEQLELFSDWALERAGSPGGQLRPRDRRALERALAWLQAEFGEEALQRVQLRESHLPEQAFDRLPYRAAEASKATGGGRLGSRAQEREAQGFRVRRRLARPVRWSDRAALRQGDERLAWGPYRLDGGWWEQPYCREYSFVRYGEQLAWLYREPDSGRTFIEGWLQ